MKILKTAYLGSNFTGFYKKKSVFIDHLAVCITEMISALV